MKRALFPGTFDPPTNGHLDILRRASALFDEVIVAVAMNPEKNPVLQPAERVRLLEEISKDLPNVRVTSFEGLAIDFAREEACTTLLRGIRTVTDFEYEYAMAIANRKIGSIETMFLVSSEEYAFLSSRLIREAAVFGGNIAPFVPPAVEKAFVAKMPKRVGRKKSGR
jgi:pantetheine-phosphate adenylyltransferase